MSSTDHKKQKSSDSAALEGPGAKEARKERKVLEKKMALNRKRKLDSRFAKAWTQFCTVDAYFLLYTENAYINCTFSGKREMFQSKRKETRKTL